MEKKSEPPQGRDPVSGVVNKDHVQQERVEGTDLFNTVYLNEQQCSNIMKILKAQREEGKNCDAMVITKDHAFWAHRCVLAANSKFFSAQFQPVISMEKVNMPHNSKNGIGALLDYMYSGHLAIGMHTVEELIELSALLKMDDIRQCCNIHLTKTVDITNWQIVSRLSKKFSFPDVQNAVVSFVQENFFLIAQGDELLSYDLDSLVAILQCCNPEEERNIEMNIMEVLLKWVMHEPSERTQHLGKLLTIIRQEKVSSSAILQLLDNPTYQDLSHQTEIVDFIGRVTCCEQMRAAEILEKLPMVGEETSINGGQDEVEGKFNVEQDSKSDGLHETPDVDSDYEPFDAVQESDSDNTVDLNVDDVQGPRKRLTIKSEGDNEIEQELLELAPVKKGRGRPRKYPPGIKKPKFHTGKRKIKVDKSLKVVGVVNKNKKPPGKKPSMKTCCTQTIEDESNPDLDLLWPKKEDVKPDPDAPGLFPMKRKRGRKAKTVDEMLPCPKCPRQFPTPSALKHHMKGHGSENPFLCDICGFTTIHFASINVHKRQHNGKKFKCTFPGCTYAAVRNTRLQDHMDGHRGVKNHVCVVCGKAFGARKHLQRHEKIHREEKPIECGDCDYKTNRKDKLRYHTKKHHPDTAVRLGMMTQMEAALGIHQKPSPPKKKKVPTATLR